MKLSEFITKLQAIKAKYGDRQVFVTIADSGGYDAIDSDTFGVFIGAEESIGDWTDPTFNQYIIGGTLCRDHEGEAFSTSIGDKTDLLNK